MSKHRTKEWEARTRSYLLRARGALAHADAFFEHCNHNEAVRRLNTAGAARSNALRAMQARPTLVPPLPKPTLRSRSRGFRWKRPGWVLGIHLQHDRMGKA